MIVYCHFNHQSNEIDSIVMIKPLVHIFTNVTQITRLKNAISSQMYISKTVAMNKKSYKWRREPFWNSSMHKQNHKTHNKMENTNFRIKSIKSDVLRHLVNINTFDFLFFVCLCLCVCVCFEMMWNNLLQLTGMYMEEYVFLC